MGLSVIVQLAYPAGRTLPFVSAAGVAVGGRTTTEAAKQLDASFASADVAFKSQNKTFTSSMAQTGADIRGIQTARAAAQYPLILRIVPFSSVALMLTRDTPAVMQYDDERLQTYAKRIEKDAFVGATNATVAVDGDKVRLVPAKPQQAYPAKAVRTVIREARFTPYTTLTMQPVTKPAQRSNQEVDHILGLAEKAINTPLTIQAGDTTKAVDKPTIGSWLSFPEDPQTKNLRLALSTERIDAYFQSKDFDLYRAPGETKIQVIDGREVGRTVGAAGQGIDVAKTVTLLEDAIKKGSKTTVKVPVAAVAAKVVYERTYSNSDAGLKALLDSLATGYGIAVMELGGRSGTVNGAKQYVAASTYKLYMAYAVVKEVEAGRMSWNETISGQTVASCFDRMIVVSDNACPKAFGSRFGWQAVEDMMHGIGLSAATQMSPATYTTPNDLALFLYKLQNGSLLSAEGTSRLIDAMKRQSYTRAGIPAGARGAAVADKVGDVDGFKHDAAIVYGPKGPYVLIVMTSGGSWAGIAAATGQIHDYLNK